MKFTKVQLLYAEIAILAFFGTEYMIFTLLQSQGFDVAQIISDALANPTTRFMSIEVTCLLITTLVWIFVESKRLCMKHSWIYYALCFLPSPAVALPVFMLIRDKKINQLPALNLKPGSVASPAA